MRTKTSNTLLALTFFIISSEAAHATEKSPWIGEWLSYDPTSMKTDPGSIISVTDFDGELIFSSTGLSYPSSPGHNTIYTLNSSACQEQTFSKDKSKVLFKYSGCKNSSFDGNKLICQMRSASEEANPMIICSAHGIDKYFRKTIKK